jgi:AraC-like DNA-binding protein
MMGISNYRLKETITINFEVGYSPVLFGFCISGNIRHVMGENKAQTDLSLCSGQSFVAFMPQWRGISKIPAGKEIACIGIWMNPSLMPAFMEGQHDRIPTEMRHIFSRPLENHFCLTSRMTPPLDMVIHQILNCPYCRPLKQMYLESKALELAVLSMAQHFSRETAAKNNPDVRPYEIERVHRAREIIQKNLQEPPSLVTLAKTVGLTHPRLNFCFRRIYGATIFEYLREMRLSVAKSLLDRGDMTVTEVAYEVGYANPSHFAKGFKDYFGATPGSYQKACISKPALKQTFNKR